MAHLTRGLKGYAKVCPAFTHSLYIGPMPFWLIYDAFMIWNITPYAIALGLVTCHDAVNHRHERRMSLNPCLGVYFLLIVEVYVHFHMEVHLPTFLYVRAGCLELCSLKASVNLQAFDEILPSALDGV